MAAGTRSSTSGAAERQGVVHRLDAGTSGLMVVAKSERAYSGLKSAFRERDGRQALPRARAGPSRTRCGAPSTRRSTGTPTTEFKFAVVADGKPSVTHYDTIEAFRAASLLDVQLETGRTHQIRVHMTALKHPLRRRPAVRRRPDADRAARPERQWLHAVRLGFAHPDDGRWVEFESPYPEDLVQP